MITNSRQQARNTGWAVLESLEPRMLLSSLTIEATWSVPTDIDLHVLEPGYEIYYAQSGPSPTGGVYGYDDTRQTGPETVVWDTVPAGNWGGEGISFWAVNFSGATSATVTFRVLVDGQQVALYTDAIGGSRWAETPRRRYDFSTQSQYDVGCVLDAVKLPKGLVTGTIVKGTAKVIIQNAGGSALPKGQTVTVELIARRQSDGQEVVLASRTQSCSSLAAGRVKSVSLKVNLPDGLAVGEYDVLARVTPLNLAESNLGNNVANRDLASQQHAIQSADSLKNRRDGNVMKWAVLVGATDYPGTIDDVPQCKTSVKHMKSVLTKRYGFKSSNVKTLVGGSSKITMDLIDQQLNWLRQNADADDVVVFYYSGHGGEGSSLFVNDDETLELPNGDSYAESRLNSQLQLFGSQTAKIVILDSCHSGGFVGLSSLNNTWVLASSRHDETSWTCSPLTCPFFRYGTVFTAWLTDGMTNGGIISKVVHPAWVTLVDTNWNWRISLREAFNYAQANTNHYSNRTPVMGPAVGDYEIPGSWQF